jgi:DNA-binding MarR family transcriptional regulator
MLIMIGQQLQDDISLLLIRASLKAKHGLIRIAEEYELNPMQALSLCVLEPGKSVPMNSLSYPLSCDPLSVTGIVDRLVAMGYATRTESTEDRRIKTISLTSTGVELREKLLRANIGIRMPGLEKLSKNEADELVRLIVKTTEISLHD